MPACCSFWGRSSFGLCCLRLVKQSRQYAGLLGSGLKGKSVSLPQSAQIAGYDFRRGLSADLEGLLGDGADFPALPDSVAAKSVIVSCAGAIVISSNSSPLGCETLSCFWRGLG